MYTVKHTSRYIKPKFLFIKISIFLSSDWIDRCNATILTNGLSFGILFLIGIVKIGIVCCNAFGYEIGTIVPKGIVRFGSRRKAPPYGEIH